MVKELLKLQEANPTAINGCNWLAYAISLERNQQTVHGSIAEHCTPDYSRQYHGDQHPVFSDAVQQLKSFASVSQQRRIIPQLRSLLSVGHV